MHKIHTKIELAGYFPLFMRKKQKITTNYTLHHDGLLTTNKQLPAKGGNIAPFGIPMASGFNPVGKVIQP